MSATNVDEVIALLEKIIAESRIAESPLGYFAALYHKVTLKVKEGIAEGFFDDGERMEQLDVIFANRYLDAYFAYQRNEAVSLSWDKTFVIGKNYWPIVLQHLLLGMNAHINLDLGIAAAEVMEGKDIELLENDFNKINQILSDLVADVEEELESIWPTLKKILKFTKKIDGFLIDFSMEIARNGAWAFAKKVHQVTDSNREEMIRQRDEKVSNNVNLIMNDSFVVKLIFGIIRLGERGGIAHKIDVLNH